MRFIWELVAGDVPGPVLRPGRICKLTTRACATWSGRTLKRMWEYLNAGNPEM